MKTFLIIILSGLSWGLRAQDVMQRRTVKLMGSRFDITMVASDSLTAEHYIDEAIAEISRIEYILSEWIPETETSRVNQNSGKVPVKVSDELFDIVKRSIQISKLTDGAFDITFASIDKIWKYDGSMKEMPTADAIKASVAKIGYENIVLNEKEHTIFLKLPGMKMGFGAIGKGYAADEVRKMMIAKGVKGGIINASGDLTTWGKQPDGKDWMIGITNPLNKNKIFAWFPIIDAAVATSGNYEKFVEFNGTRYSHIIDPRTGYPSSGLVSVTVFANSAELCDALATSVFVMGKETGLNFINQLKGVECIIVDEQNKVSYSSNIKQDNIKSE